MRKSSPHDQQPGFSSATRPPGLRSRVKVRFIGVAVVTVLHVSDPVGAQHQPRPCIRRGHSSTLGASSSNSSPYSTLYIYGGDAKTEISQAERTRTNALVSLDVSTNWSITDPPLKLVEPDNGDDYMPAKTCLGAAFSSADGQNLYCRFSRALSHTNKAMTRSNY